MPNDKFFGDSLRQAVIDGSLSEELVNDKVRRVLTQMFKFGLFERMNGTCNDAMDQAARERYLSNVTNSEHNTLARSLVASGTVLLRNEQQVLPLDPKTLRSIAVFGASADGPP